MENASKALLIASGVLVGLMIISLMLYGYGEVSSYYQSKEDAKRIEQLTDFNKEYIGYNKNDVRGSDIITLVNKIVDYNTKNDGESLSIAIKIPSPSEDERTKLFQYQFDNHYGVNLIRPGNTYLVDATIDRFSAILTEANRIENKYKPQGMAKKLTDNISTLMGHNSRKSREELLKELKIDYTVSNTEILRYYQYQQFKRAHFNCEEVTYAKNGRIQSFEFKFNGKFE